MTTATAQKHLTFSERIGDLLAFMFIHAGATICIVAAAVALGVCYLADLNVYPVIVVTGVLLFLGWCWVADQSEGGSRSPIVVARRLVWNHIKLVCGLAALCIFTFLMFGAKGKGINPGLNHPLEAFLSIIGTVCAPILLVLMIFASHVYDVHRLAFNLILSALYLTWLVFTT